MRLHGTMRVLCEITRGSGSRLPANELDKKRIVYENTNLPRLKLICVFDYQRTTSYCTLSSVFPWPIIRS